MFVLDTNVISELRRARPHGAVVEWLSGIPNQHLHVAAATIGEVQIGIEQTHRHDPGRARELENWLDEVVGTFNVLPMTAPVFRLWARLMAGRSNDHVLDGMIAATAQSNHKIVATRNVRDFVMFGVQTINPFAPTV